jgi:hypothetical protein
MKRWPLALQSMIPVMAIVMGTLLVVEGPLDRTQPIAYITAATPVAVQTMQSYVMESRKAGVSPFIPRRLATNTGRVVSFEFTDLPDLSGQRCELRWAELHATDQRPAIGSAWQYDDVLGWPDGLFFPDESTDRLEGEIWVPEPVATGAFLVRLRLVCNKLEIVRVDSEWFLVNVGVEVRKSPTVMVRTRPVATPAPRSRGAAVAPGDIVPR